MLAAVEHAGWERSAERRFWRTSFCSGRSRHRKIESFVNRYLAVLAASTTTFAVTNIDDAVLLTLFFARRIPTRRIVAGQYIGFAAIVGVSLVGVWGALAIPHRWIHFLGVIPLAIGIRHLLRVRRTDSQEPRGRTESVASIALVTLSNGADNVSVYVPFFVIGRANLWLIMVAYAVLVALWCFVGRWLGGHSFVLRAVDRWGHWAAPLIFVGLGFYVLNS
jgi:cadmium resistance protein CadD (predicted permease)